MATHHPRDGQDRKPVRGTGIFSTTIRLPSGRTAEFCGCRSHQSVEVGPETNTSLVISRLQSRSVAIILHQRVLPWKEMTSDFLFPQPAKVICPSTTVRIRCA